MANPTGLGDLLLSLALAAVLCSAAIRLSRWLGSPSFRDLYSTRPALSARLHATTDPNDDALTDLPASPDGAAPADGGKR